MDDALSCQPTEVNPDRHVAALRAFQDAARAMAFVVDATHLLKRIMDISAGALHASMGSLLMYDSDSGQLVFKAVCPETRRPLEGSTLPGDVGVAGWVFTQKTPLSVPDVSRDERFHAGVDEELLNGQPRSLIAAPLLNQKDCLGVIEVLRSQPDQPFDDLDLDILTTLACQASVVIDNAALSSRLYAQRARLITVEREIHKKLARDLHDGPAQWLAGISMNLEYIQRLMDRDLPRAKAEMDIVRVTLDKTIKQVRNLMFELRPIVLESDGLEAALEHYVDSLNHTEGMNIKLQMSASCSDLTADAQRTIFDIVREALSNVKRHAHTQEVWVSLQRDSNSTLTITVKDNGLGFNLGAVQRDYSTRGSLGMLNMLERAAAVGGELNIDSVPGYGTTVKLKVPLPHH
jgi:signal transduction histidine kinase